MNVEQFVEVFKEFGLTEAEMERWHKIFEKKFPDGHQSFLEWLGIEAKEIQNLRAKFS
ncbi:MAG: hypothetical protein HQL71_02520 [Magnetococcales bacterium]|nr:hypothetical protein [Magnetococcales bacterium]